jgi:WD40 repeat protein
MKRSWMVLSLCAIFAITCALPSSVPRSPSPHEEVPSPSTNWQEEQQSPTISASPMLPTDTWEGGQRPPISTQNVGQLGLFSFVPANSQTSFMSVAWSPDGKVLAAGNNSGVINLYASETLNLIHALDCLNYGRLNIGFSPNGEYLAGTCHSFQSNGKTDISVWKTATYELLGEISLPEKTNAGKIIFSADNQYIIAPASTKEQVTTLFFYNVNQLQNEPSTLDLDDQDKITGKLIFSPDRKKLASFFCYPATFGVWDITTKERLVSRETDYIYDLAWSPKGDLIALSTAASVILVDPDTLATRATVAVTYDDTSSKDIAFTPDGTLLAVVNQNHVYGWRDFILLADTQTGMILKEIELPRITENNVGSIHTEFRPDGVFLAASTYDVGGAIYLWGVGATLATPSQLPAATATMTFTPRPPTPTPMPGIRLYLNDNDSLSLSPPSGSGESYTECYFDCSLSWNITLSEPLIGNTYQLNLIGASHVVAYRLVQIRNSERIVLAEWLSGDREAQRGAYMNAQPGDVIQFEAELTAGGTLWLWDGSVKSFIVIAETP